MRHDDILNFLNSRLSQLENREMMIPRYVEMPGKFIGKKDFSIDDLPLIKQQIKETKAAISAIKDLRKQLK